MDTTRLRNQALSALGQREYSRKELQKKLLTAGADAADLAPVLDEMEQLGYLNHQRYTEALITKRARQGYGPRWIRQELQQAGIESEILSAALESGTHDWAQLAGKLYRKKYGSKPATDPKEKSRRARFLFSKGFSGDHLKSFLQGVDVLAEDACED